MTNAVTLERATSNQRPVIASLMQFYIYDFTELLAPDKIPELLEAGHFDDYPYLDAYWTEPDRTPFVIRVDGKLAGFALLNKHSHIGRALDHNMAEFFIARPFRRKGAARNAVHQLLAMHPGAWEVAIGSYNKPAQKFWPGAIAAAQNIDALETLSGDGISWTGPILRFVVR